MILFTERKFRTMEDKQIIELYFDRNETAIKETENKYSAYLFVTAMNILNSREDSSECVNDTYFKAWNAIPPHNPPALKYFLGKITREISIDRFRKRYSGKRVGSEYEISLEELEECVSDGEYGDPEKTVELSFLAKSIGDYLRGCKREARIIFIMRYYFCDSIKDISGFLGVGESKVKSSLFRTRRGLKKWLGLR